MMKNRSLVLSSKMYLFAIPALVMYLTFWIYPTLKLFYYSLTNFNGFSPDYHFVGLDNFKQVSTSPMLIDAIGNTMIFTFLLVIFGNLIGLALALALNAKIKGMSFYRSAAYLPTLFSAIVIGFMWTYVYMPDRGLIASFMHLVGLDGSNFNILGQSSTALYGLVIVGIWQSIGTTTIIFLAGLQTIDHSLLEAGEIDGCSQWNLIRRIKIPLLRSAITINIILSVIAGLSTFDLPFIMTSGGPGTATHTLMFAIYRLAFNEQRFSLAAAFSVVSFTIIIAITGALVLYMNKREVEM